MTNEIPKTEIPFVDEYLDYIGESESSTVSHIWCLLTCAGAALGGRLYIKLNEEYILPHLFTILYGDPAARKSTTMATALEFLRLTGYTKILPSYATLKHLFEELPAARGSVLLPGEELDGFKLGEEHVHDCMCAVDEWNGFVGGERVKSHIDKLNTLWSARMYTIPGVADPNDKKSKVYNATFPAVTILSSVTPEGYDESLGRHAEIGFISRVNLVYCERTNVRIAFPTIGSIAQKQKLISRFAALSDHSVNPTREMEFTQEAKELLARIYRIEDPIDLPYRLRNYFARRYIQLLKLCIIITAMKGEKQIGGLTVRQSNSILHFTEALLVKVASDKSNTMTAQAEMVALSILANAGKPVTFERLRSAMSPYLGSLAEARNVLEKLIQVNRIQGLVSTKTLQGGTRVGEPIPHEAYVFPKAKPKFSPDLLHPGIELLLRPAQK